MTTCAVVAVIVTFHPDPVVLTTQLAAIAPQVASVILVDNGSPLPPLPREGGELILLEDNLGLAAAQNRGIRRALDIGYSHLLLLDQDSVPSADMVSRLLAAERFCSDRGERVGAVGPCFIDPVTGAETWFHTRGPLRFRYLRCPDAQDCPTVRADLLIASGMLVRREVFADVGLMDEDLFIDLVDSEWCLRAAAAGYGLFGACAAVMNHSIGHRSVALSERAGRRGTFPVHVPLRYYYMVRNSVLLSRRPGVPGWWKVNNGMELLFLAGLLVLAAPCRGECLTMAWRGLRDGLAGCTGRFGAGGERRETKDDR